MLENREEFHVKEFWKKTQDEEIREMFPFSVGSLEDALILYRKSKEEGTNSFGKVIYHENCYLGDIWCYSIDEEYDKTAMLSIVIFEKAYWKRGAATKAGKKFIREIFDRFDLERVGAFSYSSNIGSIKLLEK